MEVLQPEHSFRSFQLKLGRTLWFISSFLPKNSFIFSLLFISVSKGHLVKPAAVHSLQKSILFHRNKFRNLIRQLYHATYRKRLRSHTSLYTKEKAKLEFNSACPLFSFLRDDNRTLKKDSNKRFMLFVVDTLANNAKSLVSYYFSDGGMKCDIYLKVSLLSNTRPRVCVWCVALPLLFHLISIIRDTLASISSSWHWGVFGQGSFNLLTLVVSAEF